MKVSYFETGRYKAPADIRPHDVVHQSSRSALEDVPRFFTKVLASFC